MNKDSFMVLGAITDKMAGTGPTLPVMQKALALS
jgi:hypothetical protein